MIKMKTLTIGGVTYEVVDAGLTENVVMHKEQTLTEEQKAQVRENIGAGTSNAESWNDIKDKPSYLPVMETEPVEILPETQLMDTGEGSFVHMEAVEGIEDGNTYVVTYNGVEYSCVAEEKDLGMGDKAVVLGNTTALGGAPSENGEPFVVMVFPPELASETGASLAVMALDGATECILAIKGINKTCIQKLDNACLDLDWLPVKRGKVILEEMTVASNTNIDAIILGSAVNCDLEVIWDGVAYVVPASVVSDGLKYTWYMAGNTSLNGYSDAHIVEEDTGEPFFILSSDRRNKTFFYAADEGEHTISISIVLHLNKMPECYLPDSVATKSYVNIRVPAWTEADEGKFLRIVNGTPTWTTIPSAEEASF